MRASPRFQLLHAPVFAVGDSMGLVPFGAVCASDPGAGAAGAHRNMIYMRQRGSRFPSNWSVTVPSSGYYRVCFYQLLSNRWCDVQPSRRLTFGANVRPSEPLVRFAGNAVSFIAHVDGTLMSDLVWLIAGTARCGTNAVLQFLSMSEIYERFATVVAGMPFSGSYRVCYRGFPYQFQLPTLLSSLTLVGSASRYGLTLMSAPVQRLLYVGDTVQIRLQGAGMSLSDSVVLVHGSTCDQTNANASIPLSFDGKGVLSTSSNVNSIFDINMTSVRFTTSGSYALCYRSFFSANSSAWTQVFPLLRVNNFFVTTVAPLNVTFAFNTTMRFNLTGFGVRSGMRDIAQLHTSPACADAAPVALRWVNTTLWTAAAEEGVPVGSWVFCYATYPATTMVVLRGHSVTIAPHFYAALPGESPFVNGVVVGTNVSLRIVGHMLPGAGDTAWWQRSASGQCGLAPLPHVSINATVTPVVGRNGPGSIFTSSPLHLAGLFIPCYTQRDGNRRVGVHAQRAELAVLPLPPTSFMPTIGGALAHVELTLLGGVGIDLTQFGRVTTCRTGDPPLPVRSPTSFQFFPPAVGPYTFCYDAMLSQNGRPVPTVQINATFFATTNISSASILPESVPVGGTVTALITGAGVTFTDKVFLCVFGPDATADETSEVVKITPDGVEQSQVSPGETSTTARFLLSFLQAGRFEVCYQSSLEVLTTTAEKIFSIGFVTVDPLVGTMVPSSVYSGISTPVTFFGSGIPHVRLAYLNPVEGLEACPNNTSGIPRDALLPVVDGTFDLVGGYRGVFVVCFVGISDTVYSSGNVMAVVPFLSTMSGSGKILQGCASNISITGSGIDSELDFFFISLSPSCMDVAAEIVGTFSTRKNATVRGVVLPPAIATYTLCYAKGGNGSDAFGFGRTLVAESSVSMSPLQFGAEIRYLCPAAVGMTFSYDIAVDGSSYWIPLLLSSTLPQLRVRYLPLRTPMVIRVNATRRPTATGDQYGRLSQGLFQGTLKNELNLQPCSSFPTNYTANQPNETRFAEAFFAMLKIVTARCPNENRVLFDTYNYAANLLVLQPDLLMSDPVLIPRTMATVLGGVTISLQLAGDLMATLNKLVKPYQPLAEDVVQAVAFAADAIFAEFGRSNESFAVQRTTAVKLVNVLFALGTSFCAQSLTTRFSTSTFSLSVTRSSDEFLSGSLQIDETSVMNVLLQPGQVVTGAGHCYVAVTNGQNPLAVGDVPVDSTESLSRAFSAQAVSFFNMPLFSVSVNPFQSSPPATQSIVIQYQYPQYLQPPYPATVSGSVYIYRALTDRWAKRSATVTGDASASRKVLISLSNITEPTLFLSGALVFTGSTAAPHVAVVRDYLLVIMVLVLIALYVLSAILGKMYDRTVDADALWLRKKAAALQPPTAGGAASPSNLTVKSAAVQTAESANLVGWRYAVAITRTAAHPVSTFRRFALTITIWACIFIVSVLYFEHSRGSFERTALVAGVLPVGFAAAVGGSLFGLALRPLLYQQARDYASVAAGATGTFIAALASFAPSSSFFVGPVIGPFVAFLVFVSVAMCTRSTMLVDALAVHWRIAGVFFSVAVMCTALLVALYYTLSPKTSPTYISDKLPLYSTLWGISLEVLVIETILSRIWMRVAVWLTRRYVAFAPMPVGKDLVSSTNNKSRVGKAAAPPTAAFPHRRGSNKQKPFEPFGFVDGQEDESFDDTGSTDERYYDLADKKVVVVATDDTTTFSDTINNQSKGSKMAKRHPSYDEILTEDEYFEAIDKTPRHHDPFFAPTPASRSPVSPLEEVNPLDRRFFAPNAAAKNNPFENSLRPLKLRTGPPRRVAGAAAGGGGFKLTRAARTVSPGPARASFKRAASPYTVHSGSHGDMTVIEFDASEVDEDMSDGQFVDVSRGSSMRSVDDHFVDAARPQPRSSPFYNHEEDPQFADVSRPASAYDPFFVDVSRPSSPPDDQFVDVSRAPSAVPTEGSLFESVSMNGSYR